jgi:hypothetical protein
MEISSKKSAFPELVNALQLKLDNSGQLIADIAGNSYKIPTPEEVVEKGFVLSVSKNLEALMELRDRIGLEIANREK